LLFVFVGPPVRQRSSPMQAPEWLDFHERSSYTSVQGYIDLP
jgi:hypothetical protein